MNRWFYRKDGKRILLLAGPSGTGKTHAMTGAHDCCRRIAGAACEHWPYPPTVHFARWQVISDGIDAPDASIVDKIRDSSEASILFLDDIGAESDRFKSGRSIDALIQLLNERDRKHRYTVINSNLSTEEWTKKDVRVADRLLRNCEYVDLSGVESYSTI